MTGAQDNASRATRKGTYVLAGLTALTVAGFAFTLARPSTAGAPARLEVVESNVQLRPASAPAFATVDASTDVAGGSRIRTDDTGSAEIDYSDGSLTRIGPNSQYKVEALQIDGERRQIVGRLEVGRTFHQVSKLSGSDSRFEVHTANAVAAVRGTAFTVNCKVRLVCEFGVTEGVVNVRGSDGSQVDLLAGQSVTVTANGTVGAVDLLSQSDPWLAENRALPRGGDLSHSKVGSAPAGTTIPGSTQSGRLPATDAPPAPRSFSSTASSSPGPSTGPSSPRSQSGAPGPSDLPGEVNERPSTATTSGPPTTAPRATSTTRPRPTSTTARPVTSTTRPGVTTSTTAGSTTSTTAGGSTTTTIGGGPDPVTTTTSTTGSTTTTTEPEATTTTTITEPETTATTEPEGSTTTTTEPETTTTTVPETTTTTRDNTPSSTIPVCPEDSPNAGNPPPCGDEDEDDGTTTTPTSSTTTTTTTTTTTIPEETTTTTSTTSTSTTTTEAETTTTTDPETTTTTRDNTPNSTIPVCPEDSPNAGNPPPCGRSEDGDEDRGRNED